MKKIVVPTDFSACAGHASDLAVKLAEQHDAKLYFYTNIPVHPLWNDLTDQEKMGFPGSFAQLYDLTKHFQEVQDKYEGSGIDFQSRYSAGSIHHAMDNLCHEENIDLIVMGSHGSSGINELIFGSNAQKLARHAPCPVLIVKDVLPESSFKRVVFASDFNTEAEVAFQQLLAFLEGTQAHISLLYIRLYPEYVDGIAAIKQRMKHFESIASNFSCERHILPHQDLEKGVQRFLVQNDADLLAIQQKKHPRLFRLIMGSTVDSWINHARIPLLVLNDKNHP